MDGSTSSDLKSETQPSKKKKVVEKTVVTVKTEANGGKLKNDGPPSDFWSWRKYGQKPIKGSPYPRGYYRCSTSKGCSAKKQVERSRTDASVLIITYTSNHNHPGPDLHTTNLNQQPKDSQTQPISEEQEHPTTPKQEHENEAEKHARQLTDSIVNKDECEDRNFHYCCQETQEENPFISVDSDVSDKTQSALCGVLNEEPIRCPRAAMAFSTQKSEENDFFDELEELPTYSSFTSFMRSNFYDERIPIVPS